jgi:hypothetical protein
MVFFFFIFEEGRSHQPAPNFPCDLLYPLLSS